MTRLPDALLARLEREGRIPPSSHQEAILAAVPAAGGPRRRPGGDSGKRSKYGAERCGCPRNHASKKECEYGRILETLARLGRVRNIRPQEVYDLAPAVVLDGRKKPALRYVADYVFEEFWEGEWREVVVDVKSVATRKNRLYRAKKHLMATVHRITIREV